MALDPGTQRRSLSPASSEGSSALASRARAKDQEGLLKKDKGYRRYAAGVERALALFDTALQEWADYISFLNRLLKALQSHPPNLAAVPNKNLVSKRLAQCLNPTLPSGVHQKALEVYACVFSILKQDGLSQDLQLYLPGISSTLTFASLSVRPIFLSLFESHILPLEQWAVRPALRAIILTLLPGLEEETSDDFERTLQILDGFKAASGNVGPGAAEEEEGAHNTQYFWQCLFLASITNPSRRLGVLAYLNRYLPKLGGAFHEKNDQPNGDGSSTSYPSSIEAVVSPEPGLLVRCFATGLADEQILIQRNFLDLLVTHFPLHSPVIQGDVPEADKELLVTAAVGVVIRRDMSLNRRLWTWFLGPGNATDLGAGSAPGSPLASATDPVGLSIKADEYGKSQYLGRFGLKPLVRSLKGMISKNSLAPSDRARPFRISLSLMDRWEVGGLVVPEIFRPIMRSVQQYEDITQSKDQFLEVLRSANVFFDGVESGLIWSEILDLVSIPEEGSSSNTEPSVANLELARFIISNFNVREEEMLIIHVPLIGLALLSMIKKLDSLTSCDDKPSPFSQQILSKSIGLTLELIDLISDRAFQVNTDASSNRDLGRQHRKWAIGTDEVVGSIQKFYVQTRENPEFAGLPFSGSEIGDLLLREASTLVSTEMSREIPDSSFKEKVHLLTALLNKVPKSEILSDGRLFGSIQSRLAPKSECDVQKLSFPAVSSMVSATISLYNVKSSAPHITYEQLSDVGVLLVQQLWSHLSPSQPNYHVEATRCIWQLQSFLWQEQILEASITGLMIGPQETDTFHLISQSSAERFAVLWNHSSLGNPGFQEGIRLSLQSHGSDQQKTDAEKINYSSLLHRPLFLMLDLLSHETCDAYPIAKGWIQVAPHLARVFEVVLARINALDCLNLNFKSDHAEARDAVFLEQAMNDIEPCQYYVHTLFNMLSVISEEGWTAVISELLPSDSIRGIPRSEEGTDGDSAMISLQLALLHLCHRIIEIQELWTTLDSSSIQPLLLRTTLSVLQQLLSGPHADRLADLKSESFLIDRLMLGGEKRDQYVQEALIDALLAALKLFLINNPVQEPPAASKHKRKGSKDTLVSSVRLSLSTEMVEKDPISLKQPLPPPRLFECLMLGLSAPSSRPVLEKWTNVLMECFPLYTGTIFQILLPLVECFVREIKKSFSELQSVFRDPGTPMPNNAERASISLLNGFEFILAKAHDRLMTDEIKTVSVKSPEQAPGFFGNMVSGVFAAEGNQARSATANNRLTVLLCFQDAVRICFTIWSWGSAVRDGDLHDSHSLASFQYASLRMRNRTRRMLEHVFAAEALECMETLVELWTKSQPSERGWEASSIIDLLHTLDGSRPKIAIPAIFNAIYSRTNPSALDPNRKSTLASNLSESDLVNFLVIYAKSLEDDVLEEIWTDCTMFLRDVLANPFPHRQILPRLMEFTAVLGEKMENTNYGEERRMRRELGELFVRLLTAIFTIKPGGYTQDQSTAVRIDKPPSNSQRSSVLPSQLGPDDVLSVLSRTMPIFSAILGDSDRIATTMTNISTHIVGPLLHSRSFPENIKSNAMELLYQLSKAPAASKSWRKDIAEAFNDGRFFRSPLHLVKPYWLGLLRQWTLVEKDRLPDLYSRLTPPTTAGIMFGVGATAARLEADRRTQLNLRRIAVLLLSSENDAFAGTLSGLLDRLEDLASATAISSPSSSTRAEIFMVFRSLVLKTSTVHLAPFWPLINSELHEAVSSVFPDDREEIYNPWSVLHACKLLDILLLLAPDEFQLHEWLFVTDTIDAIYRPNKWEPVSLVDEVSHSLGQKHMIPSTPHLSSSAEAKEGGRRPWLSSNDTRTVAKQEVVGKILRPFFDQLSIHVFEGTYSLGIPDREACLDDLLADLFHEETIAGP